MSVTPVLRRAMLLFRLITIAIVAVVTQQRMVPAVAGFGVCAPLQHQPPRTRGGSSSGQHQHHHPAAALYASTAKNSQAAVAITVNGIECIPVTIRLPVIGDVTVLEATASAQELLVDLALLLIEGENDDDDDDDNENASVKGEDEEEEENAQQLSLSHGDPYGAVLWPAASAVAAHLLLGNDAQSLCRGKRVWEVGAGTGLVSLAAAAGGARSVLATDYESIPLMLLEYAAEHLNPVAGGGGVGDGGTGERCVIQTAHFDVCDPKRREDAPWFDDADVMVAADIIYEPATGTAMAVLAVQALRAGMTVVIGDSPGRAGRPAFLAELQRLGVVGGGGRPVEFINVIGSTVTGDRHELICGKGSTTVSKQKQQPEPLTVAILQLDPSMLHTPNRSFSSQ